MKNYENLRRASEAPNIMYSDKDEINLAHNLLKMGPFGIKYKPERYTFDLTADSIKKVSSQNDQLGNKNSKKQRNYGGRFQQLVPKKHGNVIYRRNDVNYVHRDERNTRIRNGDDVAAHIIALTCFARSGPIGRT